MLGTNTQTSCHRNNHTAVSSAKEPVYKMSEERRHRGISTPVLGWCSPDVAATPRYFFFSLCEEVLFAWLGCEGRTLAASKFLPEKQRGKTNRAVCIQVKAEPQNHSLACGSQHSVPALTSPKTNTPRTGTPQLEGDESETKFSLNSNSTNRLPHTVTSPTTTKCSANSAQIFSLACHLCRSCALLAACSD